jgi:hypothetical protein
MNPQREVKFTGPSDGHNALKIDSGNLMLAFSLRRSLND